MPVSLSQLVATCVYLACHSQGVGVVSAPADGDVVLFIARYLLGKRSSLHKTDGFDHSLITEYSLQLRSSRYPFLHRRFMSCFAGSAVHV